MILVLIHDSIDRYIFGTNFVQYAIYEVLCTVGF